MKKYEWLENEIIDEDIQVDLSDYIAKVYADSHWQMNVLTNWTSVESYVKTLYVLKFIKRMTNAELRKYTKHLGFPELYKKLGWYYNSFDLKECEGLHAAELKRLHEILDMFCYETYRNNPEISKRYDMLLNNRIQLKSPTVNRFNVHNSEELFFLLYFLSVEKDLTSGEIAVLYNCSIDYIDDLLKKCNLNENRADARRKIVRNNRGNYTQATISRKKKSSIESIEQGVTGSNMEVVLRRITDSILGTYFDLSEYVCLVCLSTTSIIPPMEIDIPIIIMNKMKNTYYKYAVELDGEIWHKEIDSLNNSTTLKENRIKETDWKLIRIKLSSNTSSKTSKINSIIENASHELCQIMKKDITVGNKEIWITKTIHI